MERLLLLNVNNQGARQVYLVMGGQIVNATLVAAPKQCKTQGQKAAIKEGEATAEIWPDEPARAA